MIGVARIGIMDDVQEQQERGVRRDPARQQRAAAAGEEIPTVVVPIVQLNRSVEQRADKHPILSSICAGVVTWSRMRASSSRPTAMTTITATEHEAWDQPRSGAESTTVLA